MTAAGQPNEYRCDCGKLLFKSPFFTGRIEIKCRRCGSIKAFEGAEAPAVPRTRPATTLLAAKLQ